ncbi:hypothetical protein [Nonomuraea dietziae]|uniref:hypothetical protein n=1 Tax=Nonomuraea dietziae TaxID=65515 RepID=UPI0031D2BADB
MGAAFADVTGAAQAVLAHDMRVSSRALADAFIRGATSRGTDVIDAGLGSTDLLYYASGSLDLPGVMFTASHNPARYNGMKMCHAGAVPVGTDTGLTAIRDRAAAYLESGIPAGKPGSTIEKTCSPATPSTCARWSTCRASGRCAWPSTRATRWAATPCPPSSRGCRSR